MRFKNYKRTAKIVYGLIGTGLFLITGFFFLPAFFSSERIKQKLYNYVNEATADEYKLSIGHISFHPFGSKISLDSILLENKSRKDKRFKIRAGNVMIRGFLPYVLFPNERLRISKLVVTEPHIEIYADGQGNPEKLSKERLLSQVQALFKQKIKVIRISEIELKDARISYFGRQGNPFPFHSVNRFDLKIIGFYTSAEWIGTHKKLFRTKDVRLGISNYSRMLGDKRHQVEIGELTYSTKKNKIEANNIRLFPVDTTLANGTLYWIKIPSIVMAPVSTDQIVQSDTIRIRSLDLEQCLIRIKPSPHAIGTNFRQLHDFDLYELFKYDFRLLTIDHLSMKGAKMYIESRTGNDSLFQEFRDIKISMNGFRLDSSAWINPAKILYADNFKLSVGACLLNFTDQVHRLNASDIYASSSDSLIQSGKISLISGNRKIMLPARVNLNCDSIRLLSIDFSRLFHYREMPLREITAFNPAVNISRFGKPVNRRKDHQSLLYHFIGNYLKGIYARTVAIENGHLSIYDLQDPTDQGIIETNLCFRLSDFAIDSLTASRTEKLFYAANLDLNFSNYNMKLADEIHRLQVSRIDLSSKQKQISVRDLHLFPDKRANIREALIRLNKTELYTIRIPEFSLRNVDIHKAFFSKKLLIGNFSIDRPNIDLELFGNRKRQEKESHPDEFYELINNYLTHIEIGEIEANDGQLRLVNHGRKGKTIDLTNQFNVHLDHFILNDDELKKERLLFSDQFELTLKDHLFRLSDQVHLLKAKELRLSSIHSSVTVTDALLYPMISSPSYSDLPWHLMVKIPEIRLEQVNMKKIYYEHILEVGNLAVESPLIEIYRNREQAKLNFKDPEVPLPEELKELTVGKAQLKRGKLMIYRNTPSKQQLIAGTDIGFLISKASLKRTKNIPTARFSSENMETNLSNLQFDPVNIPYSLKVKQVSFSSVKKLLQLSDLDIRTKDNASDKIISGIRIPILQFEDLDPVDAFENNRFHTGKIYFGKPVFSLNLPEKNKPANPLYIWLPRDLQPLMDEISAEKVIVRDASFLVKKKKQTKEYHQINITLDHFRLDSIRNEKPLGSANVTIFRDDNRFKDKKGYYDFQIDRISFSSLNNTLSLGGISIRPLYSPETFQKVIPWQTDQYSGKIEEIRLEGINPDSWFENHQLKAAAARIIHPEISIYRDKRTPFNEKQYRVLPQQLIQYIEMPFRFDSVMIDRGSISYAEQPEDRPGPGIVRFSGIQGRLFPFTNMHPENRANLRLIASALFMNSSNIDVQMDFDMASQESKFKVTGSLSPFELAALNPVTENAAGIMIRSGQLNRFDFSFEADSVEAAGKLWFAYDDLKISILEQKNGDIKEAKWLSFLANNLMLRSKNPRTKTLTPDEIYFKRDPQRSIINYWWKTVFSGTKNTFGIKE